MPGFVSHTVMAHDVYKKLKNKKVNLDYMITYSLGGDLSKYAKCRYDSHHKDMDKFIYEMARYIKENNLMDDKNIMGVLYGHICHYVMDNTIHPLVRKIDKTCVNTKHNHTLIEVYYDNYLVRDVTKKNYLKQGILKTKSNQKINKMINNIYKEVYDTAKVANYYQFNLLLYKILKNIYIIFGDKLTNKVMGLNRFLKHNSDKLLNQEFDEMYELSVTLAYEYIKNVINYIKN